jgi:hypothetical protein
MKNLIRIAGVLNLLAGAFHILLGHLLVLPEGTPEFVRATIVMLNMVAIMSFLFIGLAMTFMASEVVSTSIGKLMVLYGALMYLVRAFEEAMLSPTASKAIITICVVVGLVHLAAFLLLRCPCRKGLEAQAPDQSMN